MILDIERSAKLGKYINSHAFSYLKTRIIHFPLPLKLYNTSTIWSPEGKLLAKYRKMHLFDIDIPGKCV